jgi:hypothetical protein
MDELVGCHRRVRPVRDLPGDDMSHVDPELTTIAECYRRGWHMVVVPSVGWQPCAHGSLGALPDLARLAFFREHGYDGRWGNDEATWTEAGGENRGKRPANGGSMPA